MELKLLSDTTDDSDAEVEARGHGRGSHFGASDSDFSDGLMSLGNNIQKTKSTSGKPLSLKAIHRVS